MTQKKTEAPEGKDPPADNNKRLAFLEAGSTKLGDAMIAAGWMEDVGDEEPIEAAEAELIRLGRMDQRADKLREFLGEREQVLDGAIYRQREAAWVFDLLVATEFYGAEAEARDLNASVAERASCYRHAVLLRSSE